MFGIARYVVRHKVGAVAIVALGVFFLSPSKGEEVEVSNNPWAAQQAPVQVAAADEGGFVDDLMDEAVGYLDEAGINPLDKADEAVGRFDDTAAAYSQVNAQNR